MRAPALAHALRDRLLRPGRTGLLLLALGGAWALLRGLMDLPFGRLGIGEALLPLVLLAGAVFLAPSAWQWTGDDQPMASTLRGLLQSLLWNGLWVSLALGAFLAVAEGAPRGRPDRPWRGVRGEGGHHRPWPPPNPALFHLAMGLLLSTLLGRTVAEREAAEGREAALRTHADQARALALQAQMQPHALFNALSGMVELVREDPAATEEALIALCDYLRRLMTHTRRERAPLGDERALLRDFLRVEQIRLGSRLEVVWDWDERLDALDLPPLLLQPLVENAILHGIAPSRAGGELRIACRRTGGGLCLEVANTGAEPRADAPEGTGLGHLKARLNLAWPGRATFALLREGDRTVARLDVPEAP